MININELRQLAQAATPGPDGISLSWVRLLRDFQQGASPAAITEILDRLEASEKENAKLREALVEKVVSETMLRDLSIRGGSIHASFEGGAMHLLVDAFVEQFVESGATNYLEMQFHSNVTGPLVVTLQRVNGKTAHQLRAEAEKERDALRAELTDLRNSMTFRTSLIGRIEAEREDLHALIAAVKKQVNAEFRLRMKKEIECNALRAEVEAMKRPTPSVSDS